MSQARNITGKLGSIGSMENDGSALRMLHNGVDGDGLGHNVQRKRAEELKQDRDRWSAAAEAFQQQLVDLTSKPRGSFAWLMRA